MSLRYNSKLLTNFYLFKINKTYTGNNLRNPLIHEQHNLLLNICPFLAPDLCCCKLFALGVEVVLDYPSLLLDNLSVILFLRLVAGNKTKIIYLFTHK